MEKLKLVGQYLRNTDLPLLITALLCSFYGLFLISSATGGGLTGNVKVQLIAVLLGIGAFVIMSLIDFESMSNWWTVFVIVNIVLQLLLIPFGYSGGGQRNWINFGPLSLQPGEIGKLIFIFTFSAHLSQVKDHLNEWRGIVVLGGHTLLMMLVLLITSGDSGMAIQYFMIALIMMFVAGLSLKWVGAGAVIALASVPFLWNFILHDYQKNRILVLFDPTIDPQAAYQTQQAKVAIGSGQWTGQGLLHGAMTQTAAVPEDHTDFIFAVAGEELGFLGCVAILLLLAVLLIRIFYVSYCAGTMFSSLLAVGIGGMFLFQTFMNIFMCIGLLPVMGLTLPFFSYGGTSTLVLYAALGVVAGVRMREKPAWLK